MAKRLKHKYMEEMDHHRKPTKRYHQTRKDRMHEAEGMEKRHRPKKYHQTGMDRMHESEGMKKHNKDQHRSHYK